MGRDILEDRISSFKKRKPWRPKERCPICLERERIEVEYLGFLAGSGGESGEEKELRRAFTGSQGLCAPHYGQLLELYRKVPDWIIEIHQRKYDELKRRVDNFIEFSAYGRQEEFRALSEKDQLVWRELALELRGTAD
jgi:hypothetical protein